MAQRASTSAATKPGLHQHIISELTLVYRTIESTFGHQHAIHMALRSVAENTLEYDTTEPMASAGLTVAQGMNEKVEEALSRMRDLQSLLTGVAA